MSAESTTAADSEAAPSAWPTASGVARDATRPTLLAAIHPKCPCSRATVAQLSGLLARVPKDTFAIELLMLQPAQAPEGWTDAPIVDAARALPGASITWDLDG